MSNLLCGKCVFVAPMKLTSVFYQVSSWGGYVFLINLIPMHVFALMVTGRFSHRIYIAYSTVSLQLVKDLRVGIALNDYF